MAGNFIASHDRTAIRLAAMHLTWGMPVGKDFIPWLREVKETGYEGIVSFAHSGLKSFIEQPQELKRLLENEGLVLAGVDVILQENIELYKPVFEFMQALDCHLLACIDPAGTEKDYVKYGQLLSRIGEMAQEYDINAHYHNHTDAVGENLTDMERLIKEIDFNHVSLMLDIGHATKDFVELPHRERAVRFLEKYWDEIHYIEFKDWNSTTGLNTPVGEGETDYLKIFDLIKNKGYSGWITVEQNGNEGLSLGRSPKTCAQISIDYIRTNLGI